MGSIMGTAVEEGVGVGEGVDGTSSVLTFEVGNLAASIGIHPVKVPCSIWMPPRIRVPFSITNPVGISMWASPMGVCMVRTLGERRVIRVGDDWA